MYPAKLTTSVIAATVAAMLLALFLAVPTNATSPPSSVVWFDQLIDAPPLEAASEHQLVEWLNAALLSISADPIAAVGKLPKQLRDDKTPRMIFASVSDGVRAATVIRGSGHGTAAACEQLLAHARQLEIDIRGIKIDLVHNVVHEPGLDLGQALNLPRSLFGLAFEQPHEIAFLPGELVAYTLVNTDQLVRLENIGRRPGTATLLTAASSPDFRLNLFRFSAGSYFVEGDEVLPLYRGHRRFEHLTPESLLESAKLAGAYLTQAVGPDGRFVYSYRPKTDEVRDRYNILRHAGTIYSMMELYQVSREPELLSAAERAIGYLRRAIQPCTIGETQAACVVEDQEVKLGGNGLAIVALAKHAEATGTQPHTNLISDLGSWILATQDAAGDFTIHKQPFPQGPPDRFRSQYYPGEALLALLRGGGTEPSWLEAAAKGARWLIEVRDRSVPTDRLNHDHWLLYALNDLHRRQPDPLYLDHATRITQAILERQNRKPTYLDWLGSYYRPPRSTPTATRTEGLTAAYQLERDFGDPEKAQEILEAIKLGVRFQLQTQFRPESAIYLPNPQRVLGGFRRSLENYEIRIDYVQHNISSLLALSQIRLDRPKTR